MGHRRWFKVHAEKWLRGSMRDTTSEIRGIWIDTLSLASDGFYGDEGIIQVAEGKGLADTQIARIFNIPASQWQQAKQFFLANDMLRCSGENVLEVVNWKVYQSEYQRQKQYRDKEEKPF